MISRVEYTNKRPGLRFDATKGKYIGYRIDVRVNKKRYRNLFPTKADASRFIDDLRVAKTYSRAGVQRPNRDITIGELAEMRLSGVTGKQFNLESRVLNYFLEIVGEYKKVSDITTSDLRAFIIQRSAEQTVRKELVQPHTVDRELTVISAMLHRAGEYFDELENYRPPRIPRLKLKKGRRERVITESERDELIRDLWTYAPKVARIFEFASLTGLRHNEINRIRITDLDRQGRSLKVYRSKTDSVSYISPLTDRMLELLKESYPSGYVFTPNGGYISTFYKTMRKACERCGIPYGRYTAGAIILHDTRHSFVTKLQQAGVDLATIQSFSGHSDKELVLRYSHARPDSRKRAMAAIDGKDENWSEIYEAIRSGEMSFEDFLKVVK